MPRSPELPKSQPSPLLPPPPPPMAAATTEWLLAETAAAADAPRSTSRSLEFLRCGGDTVVKTYSFEKKWDLVKMISKARLYKHFTLVNYDSRVVNISNLQVIMTLEL